MKKPVCAVCAAAPGRRGCRLRAAARICPSCCAHQRTPACAGCDYWTQAAGYHRERSAPAFVAVSEPGFEAEVDRALAMAERGQLAEAEGIIAGLLADRPDLHLVQFGMGVIRSHQRRIAEALVHFDRAVAIFPAFVEGWYNKASSHQQLLELGPMIRAYRRVIELGDPADDCVIRARDLLRDLDTQQRAATGLSLDQYLVLMDQFESAMSAMRDGDYAAALAGFQQILEQDPTSVQAHGNAGLCCAFLGRKAEALAAFDRALALDPDYEPARNNRRGVLALREGGKLAADFLTVDYYRDKHLDRRQ